MLGHLTVATLHNRSLRHIWIQAKQKSVECSSKLQIKYTIIEHCSPVRVPSLCVELPLLRLFSDQTIRHVELTFRLEYGIPTSPGMPCRGQRNFGCSVSFLEVWTATPYTMEADCAASSADQMNVQIFRLLSTILGASSGFPSSTIRRCPEQVAATLPTG